MSNLAAKKKTPASRREKKAEKPKVSLQIDLSPEDAELHNAVALAAARDLIASGK